MDEREFVRQISRAWTLLKDALHIGRFFICNTSLEIDPVFKEVTLSGDSTYGDIFKTGLSRSNYNILLNDYAFFQFCQATEATWRLGYYPNPWLTGVPSAEDQLRFLEAGEAAGELTHEDVGELLDEMPYQGAVPPVQFEHAPEQYRELVHPAAHFHIGQHGENRWPSAVALGPTAFALLIAKLYYPDAWARSSTLHGASVKDCIDKTFLAVIDSVRAVHDFSAKERRSLHFGRNIAIARAAPAPARRVQVPKPSRRRH